MTSKLSRMPRVDRVVAHPSLLELRARLGAPLLANLVRSALAEVRARIQRDDAEPVPGEEQVVELVKARGVALWSSRAQRVINATGVILHTNLGRAPLSERALAALADSAGGYTSIELDLTSGKRGRRAAFVEAALAQLAGAEAALVVNNCAAAVLLLLATVARGRPVVVSRGELVEIGGGFRVPDVMVESGARLIEVGTTNKTRLRDYERALDEHPDVAAILRVHQGNFRQLGFVARPSLSELGELSARRGTLLLKDLGGGALLDLKQLGYDGEPTVASAVSAGCHAVSFSADKVLGGPQGGVIVGRSEIVERARKHPLARALRVGRLPLVALEATMAAYLEGRAREELPTLRLAGESVEQLRQRAAEIAAAVGAGARVVETTSEMGGGALAGVLVGSAAVALHRAAWGAPDHLSARLRVGDPPVLARILNDEVVLDLRAVQPREDATLIDALRSLRDQNGQVAPPGSVSPTIVSSKAL